MEYIPIALIGSTMVIAVYMLIKIVSRSEQLQRQNIELSGVEVHRTEPYFPLNSEERQLVD